MTRTAFYLAATLCLGSLIPAGAAPAKAAKPASRPPYSAARRAGNMLYVSGQLPRTADGRDVRGSAAAQTRQVMENIGRILQAHGYSFDDVVFANVYLADMKDYPQVNPVYASFFHGEFPARACVGGQQIAFGFRLEISCVAYKDTHDEDDDDEDAE